MLPALQKYLLCPSFIIVPFFFSEVIAILTFVVITLFLFLVQFYCLGMHPEPHSIAYFCGVFCFVLLVLPGFECYKNKFLQYVLFCLHLVIPTIMLVKFMFLYQQLHVAIICSLLLPYNVPFSIGVRQFSCCIVTIL